MYLHLALRKECPPWDMHRQPLFRAVLPLLAIANTEFHKDWDLWGVLTTLTHYSSSLIQERAGAHLHRDSWQIRPNLSPPDNLALWNTLSSDTILTGMWTEKKPELHCCRLIKVTHSGGVCIPLWCQLARRREIARSSCENEKFLLVFPFYFL